MLPGLLYLMALATRRRLAAALTTILHQTPRQLLIAAVIVGGVVIDFAIPLLALGCLSYGRCPVLHP